MSKNPYSIPPMEGGGGSGGAGVSGLSTADGGTALADNAVVRGDGTTGIQGSDVTIADAGGGIVKMTVAGNAFDIGTSTGNNLRFLAGDTAHWAVSQATGYFIDAQSADCGIGRAGTSTLKIGTGSSDIKNLLHTVLVEANTAGSGTPNALGSTESCTVLTNEGATAANYHTLPTAAAGYVFEFIVQDGDGLRVVANTDDTIRVIDKVTATAGYIESTTIGSVVRLVAINATEWIATSIHGVWSDGVFTFDDTGNTTP